MTNDDNQHPNPQPHHNIAPSFGSTPPPPPPSAQPPAPIASPTPPPVPTTSPDGSVTYTSTDTEPLVRTYGTGPDPSQGAVDYVPPAPSRQRSTGIGSAGRPPRRGGFMGFLGRFFKFRLALLAIGLVIGGIGALFGLGEGTSSIGSLEPGDCFEMPEDAVRISRVTDQDCALTHDAEIYAEVTSLFDDEVEEECFRAFVDARLTLEGQPDDVELWWFEGRVRHQCAIVSPSGSLVGSIFDS